MVLSLPIFDIPPEIKIPFSMVVEALRYLEMLKNSCLSPLFCFLLLSQTLRLPRKKLQNATKSDFWIPKWRGGGVWGGIQVECLGGRYYWLKCFLDQICSKWIKLDKIGFYFEFFWIRSVPNGGGGWCE